LKEIDRSRFTFNVLKNEHVMKSTARSHVIAQVFWQLSSCATETSLYSLMNVWLKKFRLKSSISLRFKLWIIKKDFDLDINTISRDSFMNLYINKSIHNNMIFSAKSLKMITDMMFHKLWNLVKKSEFYFNQERIILRFSC